MVDQGSGAGGGAWRSSDFMKWSTYAGSSRHSCIVYLQYQVLSFFILLQPVMTVLFVLQDLLKGHGLLESELSTTSEGDRGQRRERLTERKKLRQLKRDHEQQETTKRKVLKLDEGQDDFSSGSDTERTGRGKKDKQASGPSVDIQVNLVSRVQSKNPFTWFSLICWTLLLLHRR